MKKLIKVYEEYIQLLVAEINDLAPYAHRSNWESKNYEKGAELRQKIEDQKQRIVAQIGKNATEQASKLTSSPKRECSGCNQASICKFYELSGSCMGTIKQ
jgi:hypothetical protein